jgi:hypothetical protein
LHPGILSLLARGICQRKPPSLLFHAIFRNAALIEINSENFTAPRAKGTIAGPEMRA